jgi:hypothetical protein
MKNFIKQFGIISMALVIGFSFASCGDDGGGGGGGSETLTYKGKGAASGDVYTLTIRKTAARAFTPVQGDEFELTDGTDKSKGTVDSITGSNFTLQPSNEGAPTFDATISGNDLTGLSGTITLTDGRKVTVTETLTPVTPGGGSGTWKVSTDGFSALVNVIVYGGDKFVAVGEYHRIATSPDAVSWRDRGDCPQNVTALAYGNNMLVMAGDWGLIAYSADGITWTANNVDSIGIGSIYAIAYGGDKFVAGDYNGKMAYSTDGITWTKVASSPLSDGIQVIAYGGGTFVAVCDDGTMATSPDGTTWTAVPAPPSIICSKIAYGNGKFVAGNGSLKIATSPDGTTWTVVDVSLALGYREIAYGNGKFIITSYNYISTSTDGVNWTAFSDTKLSSPITAITYGNGRFVVGTQSGGIAYSTGY